MFPFTDFLCRPIFVKLSGGLLDVDGLGCGTGQAGRSLQTASAVPTEASRSFAETY
jgi:hypothetical protein